MPARGLTIALCLISLGVAGVAAATFTRRDDLIQSFNNDTKVDGVGQYKDVDFADMDGDGLLDVMLVKSRDSNPDALLVNGCSTGTPPCAGNAASFTPELASATAAGTLPQDLFSSGTFVSYDSDTVDLDRDGRIDFLRVDSNSFSFAGTTRPRIRAWMNKSCAVDPTTCPHGFQLVDETASRLAVATPCAGDPPGSTEPCAAAGRWDDADAADINEDGYVDIGLAHRAPGKKQAFLINLAAADPGKFVAVTAADTVGQTTHDIEFGDVDDDGWMDFVVAEMDSATNYVYYHKRELTSTTVDGKTVLVPSYQGVALPGTATTSWTAQFFDYDGDDDLDLYIGNRNASDQLYENDGAGGFTEVTSSVFNATGLPISMSSIQTYDAEFGDIDNDGDIDILTTQADGRWIGNQNTQWIWDATSSKFVGTTPSVLNPTPVSGNKGTYGGTVAVTLGDLDSDGALDIFYGASPLLGLTRPVLYLNDATNTDTHKPEISSLSTWLAPPDSSAFAVKARITDRLVRVDEITAQVQFGYDSGPAVAAAPMYYVGANTYRAHVPCSALSGKNLNGFTINATDKSGNSESSGPHSMGLQLLHPTTASPAGLGAGPSAKLLNVRLKIAPFLANLEQSLSKLSVTIGTTAATITDAYTVTTASGEESWLTVRLPTTLAAGTHNLSVGLNLCGTAQTVTQTGAVKLAPYDWALAIDRTGSMGWQVEKMPAAKKAAKLFLDLNGTGDKIGAAWFAGTVAGGSGQAVEIFPMTAESALPAPTDTSPTSPYNKIDALMPSGSTSLGAGLVKAKDIFKAQPDPQEGNPIIVLISDGQENTKPFWDANSSIYFTPGDPTIKSDFVGTYPVYTIALGEDADQALLQRIAQETGGQYFFLTLAQLNTLGASRMSLFTQPAYASSLPQELPLTLRLADVYKAIQEAASGEQRVFSSVVPVTAPLPRGVDDAGDQLWGRVKATDAKFPQRQVQQFEVPEGTGSVTVAAHWADPNSPIHAVLVDPSGSVVTEGQAARIRHEDTHVTYKLTSPPDGTWSLVMGTTEKPQDVLLAVSQSSRLRLDILPPKAAVATDQPVPLRLILRGAKPGEVALEQFFTVVGPDGGNHSLRFVDDGAHGDERRADGIYGAAFEQTADGGSFSISGTLRGSAPGVGNFTRYLLSTFAVEERDTDGDRLPDRWERRNGTDPNSPDGHEDPDRDGLSNAHEVIWGTNPFQADTDGGGTNDGDEARTLLDPLDPGDDNLADSDANGNGIPDRWEEANGLPTTSDQSGADPDSDGLTNAEEYESNTNPNVADSDGDGLDDGSEVGQGSDPRDKSDTEPRDDGLPWWLILLLLAILLVLLILLWLWLR